MIPLRLGIIGRGAWATRIQTTLDLPLFVDVSRPVRMFDAVWTEALLAGTTDLPFDGAIVATPASTHHDIACALMRYQIPIFLEKPLTTSLDDAHHLLRVAQSFHAPILVDHVQLWSPAYEKAKWIISGCGPSKLAVSAVVNGNKTRPDVSPLWDYACHEIAQLIDLGIVIPRSTGPRSFRVVVDHNGIYDISVLGDGFCLRYIIDRTTYGRRLLDLRASDDLRLRIRQQSGGPPELEMSTNATRPGLRWSWPEPEWSWPEPEDQPLARSLKTFVDALRGKHDPRIGIDLAVDVITVLTDIDRRLLASQMAAG